MNKVDESPLERSPTYFSPAMRERRHKILKTTRQLIAENGVENFNLRRLCKEAGVALKTLYNSFYSKDRLIAVAIREVFDEIDENVRYSEPATSIEGIIERLVNTNQRNFRARNYTAAVTSLYFSPNSSTVVWEALQEMAFKNLMQWVKHTAEIGDFHDWVEPEALAHDVANLEFTVINDWANNRIDDAQYLRRLVLAVLTLVSGAARGATLVSVQELIKKINETGEVPDFPKAMWITNS